MIEQRVEFALPLPWTSKQFSRDRFGTVNFLVGPNGSGKSRFAESLMRSLPNSRMLGTDRLQGMGQNQGFGLYGDNFASGFQKGHFGQLKDWGRQYGGGIDTFILLEERPDLRIRVEATLSGLFNRKIAIEWDSGNLVPKAISGSTGTSYRVDREECHGIRELLVLLTHLYNNENHYLIIDEPELNLHPQYQSFFLQEVRKIAGNPVPGTPTKGIFLITHSPFMIDIRSTDDLCAVMSFSSNHETPTFIDQPGYRLASLIPRLNVHHKQLFFSDNPIFVEGILDAQIVEIIQQRRGFSITSAGSCVIEVGGCEEVNKYLELCRFLKKSACFLYDLDSIFTGSLRQCIRDDGTVSDFLAELGVGRDFVSYCGNLDRQLSDAVELIRGSDGGTPEIERLKAYIEGLTTEGRFEGKSLAKARTAVLVALHDLNAEIEGIITRELSSDIQGRLKRIVDILATKNVFLLPGGALEHYLPSYTGDRYQLEDFAKRSAVEAEILELATGLHDDNLAQRYGALFDAIARLPAKPPVDTDAVLMAYLGDYVHELQGLTLSNPGWGGDELNAHFAGQTSGMGKLFQVREFEKGQASEFRSVICILGGDNRTIEVTHSTNAGMRQFQLRPPEGEAA